MENSACVVCGRPLRSRKSKALGYGPVCAKKGKMILPKAVKTYSLGQQNLFGETYVASVDPYEEPSVDVAAHVGQVVVLTHKLSDGVAKKTGRLEVERDLLLMYKKGRSAGDYFFLLDMKYDADQIVSIKSVL